MNLLAVGVGDKATIHGAVFAAPSLLRRPSPRHATISDALSLLDRLYKICHQSFHALQRSLAYRSKDSWCAAATSGQNRYIEPFSIRGGQLARCRNRAPKTH
jgi:hypothetical protein